MPNPDRPSRPARAPGSAPARDTARHARTGRDDGSARDARDVRNTREDRNARPGRDAHRQDTPGDRAARTPGTGRGAGDRPRHDDRSTGTDRFAGPERHPRDEPRPARDEPRPELKICGVNACHAVAARRPDDVRRVYNNAALLPDFGPFLKRCAASRIAYHVVEDAELEKITQSVHHEGVCFIVREKAPVSLRQLLAVPGPRVLVYLDGVQNPHNLGAIVRVCAHFGAVGVLAAGADAAASTAMLRTAEGGGEWVEVLPVHTGPDPLLAARAAGYRLIATASRATSDLYSRPLPARVILMLGSETHGLSPALLRLADDTVRIPGTGHLDSINVACACAVLLSEYWRAHPPAA